MRSWRRLPAPVLSLCVAAAFAANGPATPQKAGEGQQPPRFRSGVAYVRVDLYPTANGRIVSDLKRDELEVFEDGVPQRIETFEHVIARAAGPESQRSEPSSIAESLEAAGDPQNRLFVLFFDTLHTLGYSGAGRAKYDPRTAGRAKYDPRTVGRALAGFLERLIGADDLFGVMTPEQSPHELTFTRRPSSFEDFLRSGAKWQERFMEDAMDDTERRYEVCYPEPPYPYAAKMIARRRELFVLTALGDLMRLLENLREGRTAVLVVSEGWTLFRPDESLSEPIDGRLPALPPIDIGGLRPGVGRQREGNLEYSECEKDRMFLARLDNEREFRAMLDAANRANVTFYPIDIRGLTTESLMNRQSDSLITLATATDGMAVVNSNDFTPGLKRIADDLSSYYLLGYYSTNPKADGRYRRITVRVKRPGVGVRARPGYRAMTEGELKTISTAAAAPRDPEIDARGRALGLLALVRADRPLHMAAGFAWDPRSKPAIAETSPVGQPRRAVLWVTGDFDLAVGRQAVWSDGAEAAITVTTASGRDVTTAVASMAAPPSRFLVRLADAPVGWGEYVVRMVVRGKRGPAEPAIETARVMVPQTPSSAAALDATPMLFRQGPFTGAGIHATADPRFRRAERLRVDVPLDRPCESVTARVLDRNGRPLSVPAAGSLAEDAGQQIARAELTLAPLAQADYLVEVTAQCGGNTARRLVAFRIVP